MQRQSQKYIGELPVDGIFIFWSNIEVKMVQKLSHGIDNFVYIFHYFLN